VARLTPAIRQVHLACACVLHRHGLRVKGCRSGLAKCPCSCGQATAQWVGEGLEGCWTCRGGLLYLQFTGWRTGRKVHAP